MPFVLYLADKIVPHCVAWCLYSGDNMAVVMDEQRDMLNGSTNYVVETAVYTFYVWETIKCQIIIVISNLR